MAQLLQPPYGALRLRKGNARVDWTPERRAKGAKSALANEMILAHPAPQASVALTTKATWMWGPVRLQWTVHRWQGRYPPYDGPFCVLERGSKNFMLEQGVGVVNMAHLVAD